MDKLVTKYVDPATEEGEGFQDELLPFPNNHQTVLQEISLELLIPQV